LTVFGSKGTILATMVNKVKKKTLIEKFKAHPKDTGSSGVQVALLTERINYLTDHLKKHKKDFHSRRGLLMLVGRRRRLLSFLKKKDPQGYNEVAKGFDLK
jgi:small subunit ribosomal protein S15